MRLAGLGALAAALSGASPTAGVEVPLSGLRSTKGEIRACLTANPGKFPDCQTDPAARRLSVPADGRALRFDGLASGNYAVALIHDENGNRKLDTFAGLPREGFGFSRNPAIRFGPPRFDAARFTLDNRMIAEPVTVRYLL
ncbi:DUF2141 domain-containing protein [Sphingomonas jatrophae]|uniref:Uncharacterized conserved protein, DUF2141 family n=1 Tax=Sphingomonas jatrophae TaxID=1166337 RepID=A0A1I6LRL8_9SPHN|nr:DUF2141 domain-containing protein [Sphingomonas jatrophae]SFS06039.1 Uncharacterized conserved protein, DUF2141 family [Sphingomonas jatrophae]